MRDGTADTDHPYAPLLKAAYPKVVATLVRLLGDVDQAEDAASEAMLRALQAWPSTGVPDQVAAWLITTARRYATDNWRREKRVAAHGEQLRVLSEAGAALGSAENGIDFERQLSRLDDDLLRLIFCCCHESLTPDTQVLLTLKVVLGFSVPEVARSLLLQPKSAERRITRAKALLKRNSDGFTLPTDLELAPRLAAVRRVIYLVFNQGYSEPQLSERARTNLIFEAIRLSRMVVRLFRFDPEIRSLLALMLLNGARQPAWMDTKGVYVPLHLQDRGLWRRGMIDEGLALIDAVFAARPPPSSMQLQAAISALHCRAPTAVETDWQQIVALYVKLIEYDPTPVIRINYACALAFGGEPHQAKRVLDSEGADKRLRDYQPYYVAQGFVCRLLGATTAAVAAYEQALLLTREPAQRRYLEQQLTACSP